MTEINEKPNTSDLSPTTTTSNMNDDQDSSKSPNPGKDAQPLEPTTPSADVVVEVDEPQNSPTDIDAVPVSEADVKEELADEIPINVEEPLISPPDLGTVSEEIDQYISSLVTSESKDDESENPDVPICVEQFVVLVEEKIQVYEGAPPFKWTELKLEESVSFLESMDRVSKLFGSLGKFSSDSKYASAINRVGTVLQRGMSYLEEAFKCLLLELHTAVDSSSPSSSSSSQKNNNDPKAQESGPQSQEDKEQQTSEAAVQHANPDPDPPEGKNNKFFREYPEEILSSLNRLAKCMIEGGFEAECCRAYFLARRNVMEERLQKLGFERHSMDEVQKMQWPPLDKKISFWNTALKECMAVEFPNERHLSALVFPDYTLISQKLFSSLARGVIVQLLNFAEAAAMIKHGTEKVDTFLEAFVVLRDVLPKVDELLLPQFREDIKSDTSLIKSRFGEESVNMLCELENSIKNDPAKQPAPGGTVHPITRWTMNYLDLLLSTHREAMEQVFREHKKIERSESGHGSDRAKNSEDLQLQVQDGPAAAAAKTDSAFQNHLAKLMDSLHSNLEIKAKSYKDVSLVSIFMMNNGRYILQKVRSSADFNSLMGDTWCRKKSSQLRQYHKNYQRETWGKALNCLMNHEGLNVNGKVVKPVLKERFKNFTAMFDEIHKTQSTWVVADVQLQSELRVSISNMVVPAYRAFLARYGQTLTPGRQTEKYVKYQPEDIETSINELFDGNTAAGASAGRRKS